MKLQIDEQIGRLPPELKQLLDDELASGNEVIDVELVPGKDCETVALILGRPFNTKTTMAPAGVVYREITATDRRIFEFITADERFALIHVKFKPMILPQLGEGPPDPTEAHIAQMTKVAQAEEVAAKAPASGAQDPSSELSNLPPDGAFNRFLNSMRITYEMWHDGDGYDLKALAELSQAELRSIESVLIKHDPRDWRDIEALAVIDSDPARQAIEAALKSADGPVRREAMKHAGQNANPRDREKLLHHALNNASFYAGLSEAIDEAAEFHPPSVMDALFRGALNRDGESAVHFAALLFFLHGKAKEPFDWNQRPFYLRFNTTDRLERQAAFRELCQVIGVDPEPFLRG